MLSNYITIAFRNLLKNKTHSFINIFGLSVGLVCCMVILLFVVGELNYDRFHREADRIYRVVTMETGERGATQRATTNTPLAPLLAAEFPEMETIVRLVPHAVSVKTGNGMLFQEDHLLFCDSAFFEMFSFELLHGDPRTALVEPFSLVLTRDSAMRYFGSADVVGRFLTLEAKHAFRVTGVLQPIPAASSIQFSMLANITSAPEVVGAWCFQHWFHPPMYTFIRLDSNVRSEEVNARFPDFVQSRLGERFAYRSYRLQPLTGIHLTPGFAHELVPTTSPVLVYTLLALGLFIILLAAINFTNLATARSLARAREVGLRKVVGARRHELIEQFLGESTLYAMIALALALLTLELLLPVFTSLTGKELDSSLLRNPTTMLSLIAFTLVVGLSAGAYPALVLSRFEPVRLFRREVGPGGSRNQRWSFACCACGCTVCHFHHSHHFDYDHPFTTLVYSEQKPRFCEGAGSRHPDTR
jgi:putative ABC transport system permease protein